MNSIYIIPGNHICYSLGTHTHHGIYCGNITYKNRLYHNVVIHFEGKLKRGQIRGISYEKFSQDQTISIVQYKEGVCYSPYKTIRRAISQLGKADYNLFGNNCEHFAHWCKTGKKISSQVNDAIGLAGGVVGGGILGGIAGAFLPVAIPGVAIAGIVVAAGYVGGNLGTDSPSYDF
ncbi:hypothetical protein NIES2111_26240 [Nostoc sp. NIES-2111]|nr:hypothetical protein NIES2111_26240 [Nostoc sp. NIES-2111]